MIKDIIIRILRRRTRRKGTFRPYQLSEPQPRGAVTRSPGIAQAPGFDRAVAQRGSHASGLTRLSAAAIRGFGLGSGGPERCPRLAQPLRLDPCPTQIARS